MFPQTAKWINSPLWADLVKTKKKRVLDFFFLPCTGTFALICLYDEIIKALSNCLSFRASSATAPRSPENVPNFSAVNNDEQGGHGAGIWFRSLYVYVYRRKWHLHDLSIIRTCWVFPLLCVEEWKQTSFIHLMASQCVHLLCLCLLCCLLYMPVSIYSAVCWHAGVLFVRVCVELPVWVACCIIMALCCHLLVSQTIWRCCCWWVWPHPGAILCFPSYWTLIRFSY